MRVAVNELSALPPDLRARSVSEGAVYAHIIKVAAQHAVRNVLSKRIRYFVPMPPDGTQPLVASMIQQSRVGFHALHGSGLCATLGRRLVGWRPALRDAGLVARLLAVTTWSTILPALYFFPLLTFALRPLDGCPE